jgi:signal transduction histidine kinase
MRFGKVENKARVAIALFVLALLLIIGLSFTLYSQARQELNIQRINQFKLEASLIHTILSQTNVEISSINLKEILQRNGIKSQAAIYDSKGIPLLASISFDRLADQGLALSSEIKNLIPQPPAITQVVIPITKEGEFYVAQSAIKENIYLRLAYSVQDESSYFAFYIVSYQIVALIVGLGLIYFLIRWLLRPYHRMVKAAEGSPVRASTEANEGEFVVNTFQALIKQFQAKEVELEALHTIERRRAEKSERFNERLIANIPSALVAIDYKGNLTSVNTQAQKLFDYANRSNYQTGDLDPSFLVDGLNYKIFFHASPKLIEMIQNCITTGVAYKREEVVINITSFHKRRIGLSISPIMDSSQHIEGALCMMTDITEVSELRERIKLQETMANLGEMAAGIAHEFKNSLATIQGYAQLFEAQSESIVTSVNRHKTIEALVKEIHLLSRLVTDFLNFAKPQNLNLGQVNLNSLLADCIQEVTPLFRQQRIHLAVTGRLSEIAGDELLLRRVFINLLRNAAEAIEFDAELKRVEIIGSTDEGQGKLYAHIRIADTGKGIADEDLPHIFIPFFTTKSRGYGIGLAIVQKIIVAHGGDVTVEKSDSSGTVFHCRLPLKASPLNVEKGL